MKSTESNGNFNAWWQVVLWAVILLKLWLVAGQGSRAIGPAPHDDWLFLDQAAHLVQGQWLGPYSDLTLAKGPFFPLFIATAFVLGIPLFLAKALLYAAACLLLIAALRPLMPQCWLRFSLFVVLWFNPITYDWEYMRALREGLLPSLVLLVVAGLAGLYTRRELALRWQWSWAVLLGASLSAFWLTREESVWLLPAIVPLWLCLLWANVRRPKSEVLRLKSEVRTPESGVRSPESGVQGLESGVWSLKSKVWRLAVVLLLPLAIWAAGLGIVSYQNWRHYGVWTTCEFKHSSFKAAYGALLRVKPAQEISNVVVPRETRERIYRVSPAFASLRPYLEGAYGRGWAENSAGHTGIPAEQMEMASGFFVWALRGAVHLAGHADSGREAMAFYAQVAREVNNACDRGLLPAGPKRTGVFPPMQPMQKQLIGPCVRQQLAFFFSFADLEVWMVEEAEVPPEYLFRFSLLTHERQIPARGGPRILGVERKWDALRLGALDAVRRLYAGLASWTGAVALLAFLAASVMALARRRLPFWLVLSWGCLAAVLGLIVILAVLHVLSLAPILDRRYLMGAYGLWLFCQFTSFLALAGAIEHERLRTKPNAVPC